ncbi:MAG: peptidase domain-containing ABC transporter [Bacteroidales bacterium]|nr:peptidase domain-containing ABC transporter [Bacteroidales bacterium]
MARFPFTRQLDAKDCGPACLSMIASHYGKHYTIQTLRQRSYITRQGVSLLGISEAADVIGFRSMGVRLTWEQLLTEAPLPCVVHWKQKHFIVVYKISAKKVWVADPAVGKLVYSKEEFLKGWIHAKQGDEEQGMCLLVEPTPDFYQHPDDPVNRRSFRFLLKYLRPHRKYLWQLLLGMIVGSLMLLILPFLTQAIVDIGIGTRDIGFVYLVLIAQLGLIFGKTGLEFLRSWILLHISTRVNVSLISDYLIKLMRLPVTFFESKLSGDILQRVGDHARIEQFLTQSGLSILFAIFNIFVFSIVLAIYNLPILLVFLLGSALYFGWISLFMRKRRELDHRRFARLTENQNTIIQLVSGIEEIKLNNCERQKRWGWETIQARLFRIRVKGLALLQYQQVGSVLVNESKNILISFMAALAVINGDMQLGVMFAIQFIIGQMNGPIDQMIGFLHASQDAKISLERLSEVHESEGEDTIDDRRTGHFPDDLGFKLDHLVFQYEGPRSEKVINDISVEIPDRKVTAIVGPSGSGKTTLLKLLLGFYAPTAGEIRIGDQPLNMIKSRIFRDACGVVMQNGYLFSDTIANNIALTGESVDEERLHEAARIANVLEFVSQLPMGFNTRIGQEGQGLSQGQRQRILIARAVYKSPRILFFDEATNSLDANNEKMIMENLGQFFMGRTVIVVAHRLSTVVNADQIIVMEHGRVLEVGNHAELIKNPESAYLKLIKNQIELGSD